MDDLMYLIERILSLEERVAALEKRTSPATPVRKTVGRGSAMADDWHPSEKAIAWAKENYPHVNIEEEVDACRDYWISTGTIRKDWEATFRNWIRRSAQFTRSTVRRPDRRSSRVSDGNDERVRAALDRLHAISPSDDNDT